MALVIWLLTVSIGSVVAFNWQRRGWIFQQNLKRVVDNHEAQIALTREFFALVDKRIYASRVYLDVLIPSSRVNLETERERYRRVVEEWNEKASGLIILLWVRFGLSLSLNMDGYFLPAFQEVDRKLGKKRKMAPDAAEQRDLTQEIRADLDRITRHARQLMDEMLYLTSETMRTLTDQPKITIENESELTFRYLFKSLFIPRSKF